VRRLTETQQTQATPSSFTPSERLSDFLFLKKGRKCSNLEEVYHFENIRGPRIVYNLPPVTAQRTTAMGYGTKYDFTKMVNGNPGPNTYKNLSIFDPNESKKRGFTMGPGRDVLSVW
jgi:hypothetical protein